MKLLLISSILLIATSGARAQSVQTFAYNIEVDENSDFSDCVAQIESLAKSKGGRIRQTLPLIGVLFAELTSETSLEVRLLPCVNAIEIDRAIGNQSRTE